METTIVKGCSVKETDLIGNPEMMPVKWVMRRKPDPKNSLKVYCDTAKYGKLQRYWISDFTCSMKRSRILRKIWNLQICDLNLWASTHGGNQKGRKNTSRSLENVQWNPNNKPKNQWFGNKGKKMQRDWKMHNSASESYAYGTKWLRDRSSNERQQTKQVLTNHNKQTQKNEKTKLI